MDYSKIEIRAQRKTSKEYPHNQKNIQRYKSEYGIDVDYPKDCLEYILELGEGALGGSIFIYPPLLAYRKSEDYHRYYQRLLEEAPIEFCDAQGKKLHWQLQTSDFSKILLIGKEPDGEIFYFKEEFYVRSDASIYKIGADLNSVFEWYKSDLIFGALDLSFFVPV